MIKVKLKQLLAQRAYEGQRITLVELAEQTGISRATLQRISNQPGHSTSTENLDKLCNALKCELNDLVEYTRD